MERGNFSDVFGGPPRRSSMYETRQLYGYSDASTGGFGVGVGEDDEDESTVPYRGSLTGSREKPVFGEGSANRRPKGNHFFNDIFGGYNSKHHSDPFSHLSLPAKAKDLPTFGSPTLTSSRIKDPTSDAMSNTYSRSLPQSRFSSQRQEEPKNDTPDVEECLKQSEKRYSASKIENYTSSSTSSRPKKVSLSSTDSVPDVPKTVVGDANKSSQRDFVMKELPLEKNKKSQPGEDHEDLQAVDAKIRKWSNGKEGNIRSLLSTLQYILWPESGWKPVPLVDIIEGNAVKRAYQRALLRLHPDKLQQKGAASHQKYIAEKVFDILQEAWNQFNSLSSF